MRARQHKLAAKKALKGNWGTAIGAMLLISVLVGIISGFTNWADANYWWIATICSIFLVTPMMVGYCWFHLDIVRTNKADLETLFGGFSENYLRNVWAGTLISIFISLWSILLIIPGIIKALAYSMTFYILRDRPELSALEAISESRKMMNGKKKDLFVLMLSFIGWILLPYALTLIGGFIVGIGIMGDGVASLAALGIFCLIVGLISSVLINFYVTPYYMTSIAVFYEKYANVNVEESYSHAG